MQLAPRLNAALARGAREREVTDRLARFSGDPAALRRYLVDAGLLERTRSGSEYALPAG